MKRINEVNLRNKTVIIRVDYNVPINDKLEITDDNRIKESLKTINYCLDNNCKIILLSHLGKVKKEEDKLKYSLKPVSERLSLLLNKQVTFVPETRGDLVKETVSKMQPCDIVMLENTRFEDLNDKKESNCDLELAKYWASLGDIFVNDAFGTCHRAHASNVGISKYLPSCLGFLVLKELDNLLPIINNPERPFTVILGGAKLSDKLKTVENLIKKADYILVGGAMAYTFLKTNNEEIGKSLVDEESLEFVKSLGFSKIDDERDNILPIDHIVSLENKEETRVVDKISPDEIGLDIGPKTRELFKSFLEKSKTIFWNGPMGYYENPIYQEGTKYLCEVISKLDVTSVVGGGDSASCVINMGYKDKFTHVSTGGGASLELLEGKELPGINI